MVRAECFHALRKSVPLEKYAQPYPPPPPNLIHFDVDVK